MKTASEFVVLPGTAPPRPEPDAGCAGAKEWAMSRERSGDRKNFALAAGTKGPRKKVFAGARRTRARCFWGPAILAYATEIRFCGGFRFRSSPKIEVLSRPPERRS